MTDTGTELAVREPAELATTTLFGTDDPAAALERAAKVATTIADLVRKQGLVQRIGQGEHVKVEGWTLLGSLLGVFPIIEWTRPLIVDEQQVGWEARAIARTRNGEVVGAGESQCLVSESHWRNRDDYARRSMAQTRAVSRALRMPLGFVMKLAGFDPLPAEEHPGTVEHDVLEGTPMSDGWEDKPADFNPSTPVKVATDAQKKKLNVLVGKLRDDDNPDARVTTERLWQAVARRRNLDWTWLVEAKRGRYDGALHWSPLREDLTHEEASALIEQLAAVEKELPPFEPGRAA